MKWKLTSDVLCDMNIHQALKVSFIKWRWGGVLAIHKLACPCSDESSKNKDAETIVGAY